MLHSKKSARPSTEFAQGQPLLLPPSRLRRMVFILMLGSRHEEHWKSMQWDEAFDQVIIRLESVVQKCAYTLFGLIPSNIWLEITHGPPYFEYASSTPKTLVAMSFVLCCFGVYANIW
ncbi:hypothetical protein K503DRAFT_777549 [Rhizopogon vinicolor AM-OR11-026]|uniref:Uncharacterized protein n=1 Tax=Rhizopogon vinicolor AM-OR11-026 TaxID=1314800 RepID=A0A1B7MFT7_9AGAM|nr:hypothetical protein K503DRAFT_777549 [Rhizopogon vinicolor AM-OR11-026]